MSSSVSVTGPVVIPAPTAFKVIPMFCHIRLFDAVHSPRRSHKILVFLRTLFRNLCDSAVRPLESISRSSPVVIDDDPDVTETRNCAFLCFPVEPGRPCRVLAVGVRRVVIVD